MSYHSLDIPGSSDRDSSARKRLNSFEHFASSYQRSVTLRSIEDINRARTYFDNETGEYEEAVVDDDGEGSFVDEESQLLGGSRRKSRTVSKYSAEPPLGTHLVDEAELRTQRSRDGDASFVVQKLEDDETGEITTHVAGQSTVPQTIFNSVNVLIGVGLLALPLGFRYSGWLLGSLMMATAGASTYYTALMLSKCLETDFTLLTFADIAYAAFGKQARVMVALLFTIELLGSGIGLVVLLADSLNAVFPAFSVTTYKIASFFVFAPMTFLPLRLLSMTSIMGIVCTCSLVMLVFFNGIYKDTSPGSLLQPMATTFLPSNWKTVPLSIGMLFSPFGGLPCLVSIRSDMRHPQKYANALVSVYTITMITDTAMGVFGYLMFGSKTMDEITKNLLTSDGYPEIMPLLVTILVGLVPLSKCPLNALPVCHTIDVMLGIEHVPFITSSSTPQAVLEDKQLFTKQSTKAMVRIVVIFLFVALAIVFPDFDRLIAFAGSLLCISTCIVLPCAFYIKIFWGKLPMWEFCLQWALLVGFSIIAVMGTAWSLLPRTFFEQYD